MKKHALFIGFNRYQDAGISRVLYAKNDAVALELFLRDRCDFVVPSLFTNQAGKRRH